MSEYVVGNIVIPGNHEEKKQLAELRKLFAEAMDNFGREEHLRGLASDMFNLLIEALPYIETAEADECYKPGAVAKLTKKIRALIEAVEEHDRPSSQQETASTPPREGQTV